MIKIIGSSSLGNSYIFDNEGEKLILELGFPFKKIKQELNFNLGGVVGSLCTHSHQDHSKGIKQAVENSIDVYLLEDTKKELKLDNYFRLHTINFKEQFKLGNYTILPFDGVHTHSKGGTCPIANFLIYHPKDLKTLFITDSYFCRYRFNNIERIMIECNYSENIIPELNPYETRLLKSHMSLETCIKTLQSYDLSKCKEIILIHLSPRHAEPVSFKKEVQKATGIKTYVAEPGLII